MHVIAVYIVALFVGQAVAVGIGLIVDRISSGASIAVFIPLYYAMYWLAWRFALHVADRPAEAPGSRPVSLAWLLAPATLALDLID